MSQTVPFSAPNPPLPWPQASPPPADSPPRRACRLARDVAAAMLGVAIGDIEVSARSRQDICLARHVAIYLAHIVFQLPFTAIAAEFGRDRSSVGYAVRRIEDRRDDAAFDALLTRHEARAAALMAPLARGERV